MLDAQTINKVSHGQNRTEQYQRAMPTQPSSKRNLKKIDNNKLAAIDPEKKKHIADRLTLDKSWGKGFVAVMVTLPHDVMVKRR